MPVAQLLPSASPTSSERAYAAFPGVGFCHDRLKVRTGTLSAWAMERQLRPWARSWWTRSRSTSRLGLPMALPVLAFPVAFTRAETGATHLIPPASDPVQGVWHLSRGDMLADFAKNVPSESDGYFNVVTHADPSTAWVIRGGEYVPVSHRSLAQFIEGAAEYNGGPVRLIACEAGACSTGLGQNLANKLGVEVLAPTEKAYVDSAGNFWTTGAWETFMPGRH